MRSSKIYGRILMKRGNAAVKTLIAIVAVLNIAIMMLFEYGLPSLASESVQTSAETDVQGNGTQDGEDGMGTIEAVEKEKASKETEAAETALAKTEADYEEEDYEEERDPEAPLLELTDYHIYLKVGDRFTYMSYIKTMEDVDGSDLSHYIHLDKDVDTSEPGEIELTYTVTSTITGKSASAVLLITITE